MQINALLYIRRGEYKDIGHTVFVQKARKGNNYAARKKMPGANYICPMEKWNSTTGDGDGIVHRVVCQGYLKA